MEDMLSSDLRQQLPIPYLDAYPYPSFIFTTPGSPHDPSLADTTINTRTYANNVVSPLTNDDSTGYVDVEGPTSLPILWANKAWKVLSNGVGLENVLNPFQFNNLRIWLLESGGGHSSKIDEKSSRFGIDDGVGWKATTGSLGIEITSTGHSPQLTLDLEINRATVRLIFIRTTFPLLPTSGVSAANNGDIIVVQTIIQPSISRSRGNGSSRHSRVTDGYAVSNPTPFQPHPVLSSTGRIGMDLYRDTESIASSGSELTESNLAALLKAGSDGSGTGRKDRRRRGRETMAMGGGGQGTVAPLPDNTGIHPIIDAGNHSTSTNGMIPPSPNMKYLENFPTPETFSSEGRTPTGDVDQQNIHLSNSPPISSASNMLDEILERQNSVMSEKESIRYLLRNNDWKAVGMPGVDDWPTWLKEIVSIILQMPHEACFWYGEDLVLIYNTPYARMAPRHPLGFGKPAAEAWADVWPGLEPLIRSTQEGGCVFRQEDLWLFEVPGYPHKVETYHRITLVPLLSPEGRCLGIFNTCNEETERVLADRRLAAMRTITDLTVSARTQDEYFEGLTDAVRLPETARDIPYMMVYHVAADEEQPVSYFSTAPRQTRRKATLTLTTSVGCNLPHPSVPDKLEIEVPVRRAEVSKSSFHAGKLTASPAMSAASSLAASRRASSLASFSNLAHHDPLIEVLEDIPTEWPFVKAFTESGLLHIEDATQLVQGFEVRCWEELPTSAVMFSLTEKGSKTPMAIVIVGLNYRRQFDLPYREWIRLLQSTLLSGLIAVRSTENDALQEQRLRELERAKEIFFSNIAHELKTPLTLIAGPINDLQDKIYDESSKNLLKMAQRNASRLTRMINSLMDFSRLEAGKLQGHFRNVNVGLVTENLATMWKSVIEKAGLKLLVQCDVSPTAFDAHIDVACWEKILFNLLSNAYKYTDTGGCITVSLSYTQYAFELTVEDTGRGIPRASVPHLTERFHRTQEAENSGIEGTGIGLAYASELIKLHGGHLSIESKTAEESDDGSHGSTFLVIIPLGTDHLDQDHVELAEMDMQPTKYGLDFIDEATQWNRERSDSSSDSTSDYGSGIDSSEGIGSGLRGLTNSTLFFDKSSDVILVADDNIDMRKYLKSLFAPYVKTVLEAKDGKQALQLAEQHKPTVILSDVTMPRMSGTELLHQVRSRPALASIPVVLITAKAGEDDRVDGLLSGADDYLSKPFKARELIARVNIHAQLGKRRTALERRFAERTAELQSITDYAPVGIVKCTPEGSLTFANDVWYDQSGFLPRGQAPGNDWGVFVHDDDIEGLVADWRDFLYGEPSEREFHWRWKNGSHMVGNFVRLDKISPTLGGCIGCTTDISQQKRNEEEQQKRLEEEKQRRMEAVAAKQQQELLIDVTSHELRNPISAVIQCSTVVNENLQELRSALEDHLTGTRVFKPSEEIINVLNEDIDALESIYQCGLSQSRIADDVLSLGRIQLDMLQIHPIPTDLRHEAKKLLSIFSTEARKLDITLSLDFGPGVQQYGPYILADPVRLGQVVTNLVNNAIRFTQTSDMRRIHVRFDLSLDPPNDDSCLMPTGPNRKEWTPGQDIFIYASFEDSGPGLAPKELEKLFRRFSQASSQTHTVFGGSGLGLFVCRKICEMMNGRIEVASTFGLGSTFRFYVEAKACASPDGVVPFVSPPVEDRPEAVMQPTTLKPAAPYRSCLVVEDNFINSRILVRQLRKAGYEAEPAFNGQEGLKKLEESGYSFDCVLMDLEMPIMDGLTAIRQLRATEAEQGLKHNLVIALTGNAREQQKQNALDSGMDAVVIKPYSAQQLLDQIDRMVAARNKGDNTSDPGLKAAAGETNIDD